MTEGEVVITGSGQAGTIQWISGDSMQVLLRSGEVWTGASNLCREPQSAEDLAAAPVEVVRPEPKRKRSHRQ